MKTAIRNRMPEDQLARNAGDPVMAPWSNIESLLATLIDEIRNLQWMYASVNSESRVPKPKPIPRPGLNGRRQRGKSMTLEQAQAIDPRLRGLAEAEAQALLDQFTGGHNG